MNNVSEHLLVALAPGFGFRRLFSNEMGKTLKAFKPKVVSLLNDDLGIAKQYFDDLNIETTSVRVERYPRDQLKGVSHAVFFWDGRSLSETIHYALTNDIRTRVVAVKITAVANKDRGDIFDTYIGRSSPWGNPFPIGFEEGADNRDDVIRKYRDYFYEEIVKDPERLKAIRSLQGKRLGCHCKPLPCHGDVIAEFLNSDEPDSDAD